MSAIRRRRGYVLVAAICLLTLVSVLAFAAFGFVHALDVASHSVVAEARLEMAADDVLSIVRDTLRTARGRPGWLRTGETLTVPANVAGGLRATGTITRTESGLYWLTANVRDRGGGLRRTGVMMRTFTWDVRAALAAGGDVRVREGFAISEDTADCAEAPFGPTVLLAPGAELHVDGGGPAPLSGVLEALGHPEFFRHLMDRPWEELAAAATHQLAHGASLAPGPGSGDCPGISPNDWGDPGAQPGTGCGEYRPVVHAAGDLELFGGRGAGLLLVEGRLRITGPIHFAGVVVALGGLSLDAEGALLEGTVLARSGGAWPDAPAASLSGLSELRHSICAADRAAAAFGPVREVQGRSWAELF